MEESKEAVEGKKPNSVQNELKKETTEPSVTKNPVVRRRRSSTSANSGSKTASRTLSITPVSSRSVASGSARPKINAVTTKTSPASTAPIVKTAEVPKEVKTMGVEKKKSEPKDRKPVKAKVISDKHKPDSAKEEKEKLKAAKKEEKENQKAEKKAAKKAEEKLKDAKKKTKKAQKKVDKLKKKVAKAKKKDVKKNKIKSLKNKLTKAKAKLDGKNKQPIEEEKPIV